MLIIEVWRIEESNCEKPSRVVAVVKGDISKKYEWDSYVSTRKVLQEIMRDLNLKNHPKYVRLERWERHGLCHEWGFKLVYEV